MDHSLILVHVLILIHGDHDHVLSLLKEFAMKFNLTYIIHAVLLFLVVFLRQIKLKNTRAAPVIEAWEGYGARRDG